MTSTVSLVHSFAFFELANNTLKAVMLGIAFEVGQCAVLMSLLTSKREQSRIMPWLLMIVLTTVQVIGNIFSSYKYLSLHSMTDLKYFKEPIFIWTSLPDDITTVIITYLVGGILPLTTLCLASMVTNYLMEHEPVSPPQDDGSIEQKSKRVPESQTELQSESHIELLAPTAPPKLTQSGFLNLR